MTVVLCGISSSFEELFPILRQITHVLLTRAPLYSSRRTFAFDLHVLGTPPALVLSQNQTLQLTISPKQLLLFEFGCFGYLTNLKISILYNSLIKFELPKKLTLAKTVTSYLVFREQACKRRPREIVFFRILVNKKHDDFQGITKLVA